MPVTVVRCCRLRYLGRTTWNNSISIGFDRTHPLKMFELMRCVFCVAGIVLLLPLASFGQTLTEKLSAEEPEKLVLAAQESGDVVRGAILFHQGNINCAKCHRPLAEQDRIGPDLSRLEPSVADVTLVESILHPSKNIRKGYETFSVVTSDGLVRTGTIVEQDEQHVVLRTREQIDQRTTVRRSDIELMQPSDRSNMPDGLANQLKNRQQFLDLLRYVIELRHRGPPPATAGAQRGARRELSTALRGLVLIDRLNCGACHQTAANPLRKAAPSAPDLRWSVRRLNPAALAEFVARPHTIKPGSRMPDMMNGRSDLQRKAAAESIVNYLVSVVGSEFESAVDADQSESSAERGYELFHSVGCVACHAPRDTAAMEQPLPNSVPLGNLTAKFDSTALTAFLENPHQARPSGRMPNMQLRHREAGDLASFLLQSSEGKSNVPAVSWSPQPELIAAGRRLFKQLQCANCHLDTNSPDAVSATLPPLSDCDVSAGCLSSASGDWPSFALSEEDRQLIRAGIERLDSPLSSQQRIDVALVSLNCVACHTRERLGGVAADRRHYFQTTNLNLGEQGRIPPTLTGVGAKLKRDWMRDVLVNRRSVRPYMKTRMPQFGEENVSDLIELLQDTDQLPEIQFAEFDDQKEMRKQGLEIAGNRGLNCVACHTYQYKLSDTMPAVDLTEMAQRLRKKWFYQYMLSPQTFVPNTVMPSFWPGGRAIRPDIRGTPEEQVEALWQYLLDGRQAAAPRGVMREPLEIVVTDRARLLRRSYPGIGKRGIGVGYPGQVNLAFDAEQMRLALIWKGGFVDPAGVWYGQGHGRVRPLGRPLEFSKGPDLDRAQDPWAADDGRPPHHQFRGYELDETGRPTFRYTCGALAVEDFFTEVSGGDPGVFRLQRRVRLSMPEEAADTPERFRFRIAASDRIKAESPNTFIIGDRLKVQIRSHQTAILRSEDGTLQIPLQIKSGRTLELILEYDWQ